MINAAQKFNLRESQKKLAEIMDAKAPAVPMAKEELKKAVLNNLPKADNPDVRDLNAFLGVEKDILPGQLRKERTIEKFVDKKQNSMKDFAIKRDAAMFATAEFEISYKENHNNRTTEQFLKELHDKWLMYFEGVYGDQNNESQ